MDSVKRKLKNGGVSKIVTSRSITQAINKTIRLVRTVPSKPCSHQDLSQSSFFEFSTDGGQDGAEFPSPVDSATEHGVRDSSHYDASTRSHPSTF
jgi:hypothetical protein